MNSRALTLATIVIVALAVAAFLLVPRLTRGPAAELDLSTQPTLGQTDAPVTVALFEDFRCPACAQFTEEVLPRVERELVETGRARIAFVNLPVLGPASQTAAAIGECVYREGGDTAFWTFKTPYMRSQRELENRARALELAAEFSGVDRGALATCLDDATVASAVAADAALAQSAGLTSTPSVLVDGQRVNASFDAIRSAVERNASP